MSGKIQITGGLYQNFEGAPLANGYLIVQLSHDGQESVDPGLINGYPKIQINLDSNGNIPVSPATNIWPNDQILPSGTFYTVNGYAADGTLVFGPQTWSLTSGTSPYNIANIVPSNPPGSGLGGASVTGPLLETGGAVNSNQSLLNLAAGTNVTIANVSGTTTINATGGGTFATSGQGWFAGPGITDFITICTGSGSGGNSHIIDITGPVSANSVVVQQFVLQSSWTLAKISYEFNGTTAGGKVYFGIYSAAGNKLTEAQFDGNSASLQSLAISNAPLVLAPGTYYFAASSTSNTITGPSLGAATAAGSIMAALNAVTVKWGYAANSVSAGLMPATLGALTALTSSNADTIPIPIWTV